MPLELFGTSYEIRFAELARSLRESGRLELFEVGCGISGCCGSGEVLVERQAGRVTWTLVEDRAQRYSFEEPEYQAELARVLRAQAKLAGYAGVPLVAAASEGDTEVLEALLAAEHPLEMRESGFTALLVATDKGRLDSVELLLRAGADVNAVTQRFHRTSLHLAAREGLTEIAKRLLETGASVDLRDDWGWTPMDHALWEDECPEMLALLKEKGATPARTNEERRRDRWGS